jgi:hypothetical protein
VNDPLTEAEVIDVGEAKGIEALIASKGAVKLSNLIQSNY